MSVKFHRGVFREYDVRGVADLHLTDELARALGRALAGLLGAGHGRAVRLAVGRDCRLTSPRLFAALVDGARTGGLDVVDVGVIPTPMLYFAAHHLGTDGAVIVTGSHNPGEDNGFKILRGKAALHGEEIRALADAIERGDLPSAARRGGLEQADVSEAYLAHATSALRLGPRRFKVVVDAGNGAGGPTAVALYRRLGFDVVPLYCDMDGRFPNHHPDPTVADNLTDLVAAVAREGAELGIALDGDADRIGAIDRRGRILWGDQLMILFGRAILAEHPGATFIAEVKCSQALFDELTRAGGRPILWKVGHSLIKAKIKETGALLGGEMSGHMFFAHRYLGFDDAIYAGGRLLEILSQTDAPLTALYDSLPVMVNTPEIRIDCPDAVKFDVVRRATEQLRAHPEVTSIVEVDGARVSFGDGWGLVRASNTQPSLVVRCEAGEPTRLAAIRAVIERAIGVARSEIGGGSSK